MSKVKLKEIGLFKNGLNFSADRVAKGCKMIGIPDFGDRYFADLSNLSEIDNTIVPDECTLKDGDILFVRSNGNKALVGRTMIIKEISERITFSGFCIRFRPNSEIAIPLYLLLLFKSPVFRKRFSNTQQTSINNINQEVLGEIEIDLPSKDEQQKIINCIFPIIRKIEINNAVNDNLQQQLKLMYDYWFNQFDFPNEDGKPYRASGGKMRYSHRLKRDIPEGWTEESVISNSISAPIKPGVEPFSTKIYLATADVSGTRLSAGSLIDYETREGRANMQPTVSSVWFAKMKNSIKHLFLNREMNQLIDSTILSTGFCGLQCTDKSFEYIAAFIEHSYFEDIKNILAHGATQESVNNDDLLGLAMLVPTSEVLEMFHAKAKPLYAQISQNICENQKLTEIRDWLLPMLMNGQATISD